MASELQYFDRVNTGRTNYYVLMIQGDAVASGSGLTSFDVTLTNTIVRDNSIALSDLGHPGIYLADMPEGLPAGRFVPVVFQSSGVPSSTGTATDALLNVGNAIDWDGLQVTSSPTATTTAAATAALLASTIRVEALSPVDADGDTTIVVGDDYANDSLQDRRLTYTITGYSGSVSGATVRWRAVPRHAYDHNDAAPAELTITTGATASLSGTTLTLKVPLTVTQTAGFRNKATNAAIANYKITVALIGTSGEVLTQVLGDGYVLKAIS